MQKIETFQGNESDIVIFDIAPTGSLGFMRHFQRLNVAFSRGRYALYFPYNRILIDYNIFVGPPLLIALMEFAKSNRLVHAMLEPLAESFPDLPTLNHDIQKANKSYEACHSSEHQFTRCRAASCFILLFCLC